MCGKPASEVQLAQWAGEIGSDIPFFFSSGTAYCTGRGEMMRSLPPLPKGDLHIVKPSQGLSTPQVYSLLNTAALPQRDPVTALDSFLNGCASYFNDLEVPAFSVLPQLAELKSSLRSYGFSDVMMSGSGSAFFCVGNGIVPALPHVAIYQTNYLNRKEGSWFVRT